MNANVQHPLPSTAGAAPAGRALLPAAAWAAALLGSALPVILLREVVGIGTSTLSWIQLAAPALLAAALRWRPLAPLRLYAALLLIVPLLDNAARPWQAALPGGYAGALAGQLLRLLPALAAGLLLAAAGLRRRELFLVRGEMAAPAAPTPWLGVRTVQPWSRFGRDMLLGVVGVMVVVTALTARPGAAELARLLPALPGLLFLAALNAFGENFIYRAAPLSQLLPLFGPRQALLLTAIPFALGHFYGAPPGLTGVLLAGFLGWLLGKSMIETRGFAWAWLIQWPLDVLALMLMLLL